MTACKTVATRTDRDEGVKLAKLVQKLTISMFIHVPANNSTNIL